jgi:hypothetical protein
MCKGVKYLVYEQPKNKVYVEIAWNSKLMNRYLVILKSFFKYLNNKQKFIRLLKLIKNIICIINIYNIISNPIFMMNFN